MATRDPATDAGYTVSQMLYLSLGTSSPITPVRAQVRSGTYVFVIEGVVNASVWDWIFASQSTNGLLGTVIPH